MPCRPDRISVDADAPRTTIIGIINQYTNMLGNIIGIIDQCTNARKPVCSRLLMLSGIIYVHTNGGGLIVMTILVSVSTRQRLAVREKWSRRV